MARVLGRVVITRMEAPEGRDFYLSLLQLSRSLEQSLAASRCSGNTCLAGALCRPDGSRGSAAEKASC